MTRFTRLAAFVALVATAPIAVASAAPMNAKAPLGYIAHAATQFEGFRTSAATEDTAYRPDQFAGTNGTLIDQDAMFGNATTHQAATKTFGLTMQVSWDRH